MLGKTVFDLLPRHEAKLISGMEQRILREETQMLSEEFSIELDGQMM
ncbi:MAG: hypothetical protein GY801_37600 [bacterium]|nr:hypothetical protein [bacterium]